MVTLGGGGKNECDPVYETLSTLTSGTFFTFTVFVILHGTLTVTSLG